MKISYNGPFTHLLLVPKRLWVLMTLKDGRYFIQKGIKAGIFVSYNCCENYHRLGVLKQQKFIFPQVWRLEVPNRVWQVCTPSGGSRGRMCPLSLPDSWWWHWLVAASCQFLPPFSQGLLCVCLFSLCLLTLVMAFRQHLNNPGQCFHFKTLISTKKPYNIR